MYNPFSVNKAVSRVSVHIVALQTPLKDPLSFEFGCKRIENLVYAACYKYAMIKRENVDKDKNTLTLIQV